MTRNGSAVVAWRVPDHAIGGWRITASHSDAPPGGSRHHTVKTDGCLRLSVEGYGGMIMSTWLDRPLTVAGRVLVRTEDGAGKPPGRPRPGSAGHPILAIHMQRTLNNGHEFNPQVDMQPLWGLGVATLPRPAG